MEDNLIKISELIPTTELKSADRIPIEQDGQTRSIKGAILEQKLLDKTDARYIENAQKGAPNGIAPLDDDSKVPNENLNFGKVEEGDSGIVSGGEVYLKTPTKVSLGIFDIKKDVNIIEELTLSSKTNSELWGKGQLNNVGEINVSDVSLYSLQYYPILKGEYSVRLVMNGGRRAHVYDSDFNVIQIIANPNTDQSNYEFDIIIDNDKARWIRITQIEMYSNSTIFIKAKEDYKLISDDVFLTKNGNEVKGIVDNSVNSKMGYFGFSVIEKNTNIFNDINDKILEENEWFGKGYITTLGTIDPQGRRFHTKGKPRVYEGNTYEYELYFEGNDCFAIYDKKDNLVLAVKNPGPTATFKGEVKIPKGGYYVKTTQMLGQQYVPRVFFKNKEEIKIYPSLSSDNGNLKEVLKLSHTPKNNFPIVTFVADDCYVENDWFVQTLEDKGVRGTLAVITGYWDNPEMKDKVYTRDKLIDLKNKGWDLAGHTHNHPRLADITVDSMKDELYLNKKFLSTINSKNNIFVAPFGSRNQEVDKEVRKYFDCDIRSNYFYNSASFVGVSNTPPINTYLLNRFSFDVNERNISIIDKLKQVVDQTILEKGWLIFAVHPQYNEYRLDLAGGQMRRQELSDIIDYIKGLNVPIMTATDALEVFKNPIQIGNKDLDPSYWELGMNGNEIGNYFE